jgi:hypothetical protein
MRPEELDQVVAAMDQAAARFTKRSAIRDLEHTLAEIVNGAVAAVPGATHAGMTVRQRDGRLTSTAPTSELVARLDQAQAALGEGPCVLAVSAHHEDTATADGQGVAPADAVVVRVDDMPAEADDGDRWPRFGPEAVRDNINSMMSIQLVGDQAEVTALNLYAQQPHVFDDAAETQAEKLRHPTAEAAAALARPGRYRTWRSPAAGSRSAAGPGVTHTIRASCQSRRSARTWSIMVTSAVFPGCHAPSRWRWSRRTPGRPRGRAGWRSTRTPAGRPVRRSR